MRWIADDGKAQIEKAIDMITSHDCAGSRVIAAATLLGAKLQLMNVLADMTRLEKEQPNPEPRVVTLTTDELRRIYPERFINSN